MLVPLHVLYVVECSAALEGNQQHQQGRAMFTSARKPSTRCCSHRVLQVYKSAGQGNLGVIGAQCLLQDFQLLVHESGQHVGVVSLILGDEEVSCGQLLL